MSDWSRMNKFVAAVLVLLFFSVGCSVKKSCSADTQCDEGSFCSSDDKCVEFKADDYAIIFENLSDGQSVTSANDVDRSKDGTQIDIPVRVNDTAKVVKDGSIMILSVTAKGEVPVLYSGTTIKDRVIFSLVTIPFGEVTIKSYLSVNPSTVTEIKLNSKHIGISLYYLKNGADGTKTILDDATVTDSDDADGLTSNGIQLAMLASSTGLETGSSIKIFMPDVQEAFIIEAVIDEEGNANFGLVNIPLLAKVRISAVSGDYTENIEFSVDSNLYCGFNVNLENNKIFGIADDVNTEIENLQFDLTISDITGCEKGSKVSVYIDKKPGDGITPDAAFYTAASTAQERITLPASKNANDKREVFIVMEDSAKDIKGSAEFTGITVDFEPPLVETIFPETGQVLNTGYDTDTTTPGIQVQFTGNASDTVTPPVTVYVKLGDIVISEQSVSDGSFATDYSFSQSYSSLTLNVVAVDGAGNSSESSVPFSVNYLDTNLKFVSVCGHEGSSILNGMWLNSYDDTDSETEDLQCAVIVQAAENSGIDEISLKAGDGELVKKVVDSDNKAEFPMSFKDTNSGIMLNAVAYTNENEVDQNSLLVKVDTVLPVATMSNDLMLNNGETTSAVEMTFNFTCSESSCTYNSLLDSEVTDTYNSSASRTVMGLASGTHAFKVRARDEAGNVGNQSVFNWTVDSTAPETTITSDPGSGSTSDFALFTFESSKAGSLFKCRLEKDGVYFIPADGSWEACNTGKRDYYGLENGTYKFYVRAEDSLGNVDPSPAEHEWVVGTEAPVTTITGVIPSDAVTNSTSINFAFEATVKSTFQCKLSKDDSVLSDWSDCSLGSKNYSGLEDGSYLFEVKATALYGVKENTPAAYGWTVDTISPKIRFLSKPAVSSPFNSGDFAFECVGESNPCSFACTLDGSTVNCSGGTYSYSALSAGSHRFIVVATDSAGNNSVTVSDPSDEFVNDYSWEIDSSVLGVQITSKPDSISNSANATFAFSSNKAASFECKTDSGEYASCSSPESYTGLSDGTHIFYVKASFGTDSATDSYTWTIDTTNPVITISNAPENPTFQTGATFSFSVNESVTLECKLSTSTTWESCSSPKIYPTGTFGVADTEQTYTFEIRATDKAGNSSSVSHTWTVDLAGPAIEWISPAPDTNGKIIVTKADDVYPTDSSVYAVSIKLKISGSNAGKPITVTGFKTPPGYTTVYVDTASSKEYTLVVGLQDGARVNNPLTITVSDNTGLTASINKVVIVNTSDPTITWAYPEDGYKFISGTATPSFVFNVWNSEPGTTVELIDADTGDSIASGTTVGATGSQEYITIKPSLSDRCTAYKLYALFYDSSTATTYYTNSTTDLYLKTTRSFTVDKTKIVFDNVSITGVTASDRILNRADNLNSDPDGGMQTNISIEVSDAGNSSDSKKSVKIFTDNGSGLTPSILLSSLNNISDEADFANVSLGEYIHTIKVQATDCSGNITTKTLAPVTVDTIAPELTVISPKGSSANWRWIVAADDPELGTINGSNEFTGVNMEISSNEKLGTFKEVIHTAYDYNDSQLYQNDISSSATVSTNSVEITLPDLEYAKHRFAVTVEDAAGNPETIGDGVNDLFEVDPIVPALTFTNIADGAEFSTDMDGSTPGFQITFQMNVTDVEPSSTYTITAVPILSQGGSADNSRLTKTWSGTVISDGSITRNATMGSGWWRISSEIKDNHLNKSLTPASGGYDINISANIPTIDVRKGTGYEQGAGPILTGTTLEMPSWFIPGDISCTGNICETEIEVWTNAPAGSTAYVSVNGGTETSSGTVSADSKSMAVFTLSFDASLDYNTLSVRVLSSGSTENAETYYIKIDRTSPVLTLINPAECSSGSTICNRLDLTDDPATDVIELAELGFGYQDNSVYGSVLHFKSASSIQFEVSGAEAGTVAVESVSGISNGLADIQFDSGSGKYLASLENMTAQDSNANGQKDYNLVFKVTESPSGAVSRYLIKLHVDLVEPAEINISGKVSTYDKEGKIKIDWVAIQGNSSSYGVNPGAIYKYDVRYQNYGDGSCSLSTNFDTAVEPLTTIAGPVPDAMVGEMSYTFYVNRINNGKTSSDPLFREFDTHKNGDSYCFAVRAVDAVYAEDGTVLALNEGAVIQEDKGKMELSWSTIREDNPKSHLILLRNLGDLDNDGFDDFVIADGYKSSNGTDDDYAGNVQIHFSQGTSSFEISGEPDESVGQGISGKADFNGDGYLDFAYTNVNGAVFVYYGTETGLSTVTETAFTAKDNSRQTARTMATGDYNGDGCDDIAVSAPTAAGSGVTRGQIFIYFGRGSSCESSTVIDGDSPDVEFEGKSDNDKLGRGEIYSVGDINNDGKTDFAFSTDKQIYIAYGGDSGGAVPSYTLTGFNSLVGRRIGYGDFNGDGYSDLAVGNISMIYVYYGSDTGISTTPDITINDISTINYTYSPAVTNFARAIAPVATDINGDGLSDLITASDRGLLIYQTHLGTLSTMPSIYDSYVSTTSTNLKILMLDYGIVYCDNATDKGSCYILNYGE